LQRLKHAAVSAQWELAGGATSAEELLEQLVRHSPDVVVIDVRLGPEAERNVREAGGTIPVVRVGDPAEQEGVVTMEALRQAILALPGPGGPVRR